MTCAWGDCGRNKENKKWKIHEIHTHTHEHCMYAHFCCAVLNFVFSEPKIYFGVCSCLFCFQFYFRLNHDLPQKMVMHIKIIGGLATYQHTNNHNKLLSFKHVSMSKSRLYMHMIYNVYVPYIFFCISFTQSLSHLSVSLCLYIHIYTYV